MPVEGKASDWFLWLIGASCLIAIFCAFYFFYHKKNYEFIVEASCDQSREICFQRDCSDPDNCPPNGLSNFKRYSLSAADFHFCENEDCTNACQTGKVGCESIECVEDLEAGESCSSFTPIETE